MTLFLFSLRMSLSIYITPLTLAVLWPQHPRLLSEGLARSPEAVEITPNFPAKSALSYSCKGDTFACKGPISLMMEDCRNAALLTLEFLSK